MGWDLTTIPCAPDLSGGNDILYPFYHFSTHHLPSTHSLSLSHTHTLLRTLFSETPKGTTFEIQD